MPIVPARLAHTAEGVTYSETFDDIYHSGDGGPGQARHVFLAGNALPQRWQAQERFVILETGFGLGLNFLATWQAWQEDPQRCTRLHFISYELHPFNREDLIELHRQWPQFSALAQALHSQWPVLAPGMHRLHFDQDRVTLTLYFGDARDGLEQTVARADAFYLDGFSPAKNPQLWSARVFHLLARLAAPGATLATWSVAGEVREGLRRAGFEVGKTAGFGGKRHMLTGHYARSAQTNAGPAAPSLHPGTPLTRRHAVVIGAGIAGCSIAERLAARGWQIDLIDQGEAPATGASGNHAGVLRPLPSLDDNRMSRLTRAGTLYGWRHIAQLVAQGHAVRAEPCGVLHLARDTNQEMKMQAVVERLGLPPQHLRFVTREHASALAGCAVASGGWWFADSGWVQPPSLCAANLAARAALIQPHFGQRVDHVEHGPAGWLAIAKDGRTIARAPVMVLAAGTSVRVLSRGMALPTAYATPLSPGSDDDSEKAFELPVVSARGQVSLLPAAAQSAPHVVVCRGGYVSPAVDGLRCAGATFDVDDEDHQLRLRDHQDNLTKLEAMLPGYTAGIDPAALNGRVGFRPASPDRLPMVGALPSQPGLYALAGFGARGLVWNALAAELLASQIEDEPLPLERDLVQALMPDRFAHPGNVRHRHTRSTIADT